MCFTYVQSRENFASERRFQRYLYRASKPFLTMEVLASILGAIVAEAGRSVCGSVNSNITSLSRWKSNIHALETEMKNLTDLRIEVNRRLEPPDGRDSSRKVEEWLRITEEFLIDTRVIQAKISAKENGLRGCARIRFCRKLGRAVEKTQRLVKDGHNFSGGFLPEKVEHIPGRSIPRDQTTSSRTLEKLVEMLDDERYARIGVWGMGGVGKTTLMKNLNNDLGRRRTRLKRPFSVVIWATVSKDSDTKRVQKQIAERLNLVVRAEESVERTARRLYQRLDREERFLLILDDLWERIDLDCLGVPSREGSSKLVLTTRSLEICGSMMTNINVKVDTLSENEAWDLFCLNAGEVASSERIKQFAEDVVRECGGLPLAIVTAGAAMRGKTRPSLWKHALSELQRSIPFAGGIKARVFSPLKLSYDSLESDEAKACFLYCALFPEDFSIEVGDLARYWSSEGLIDENHGFASSYNKALAVVEALKDSCLLEEGDQEDTVKMHDVVRDVAIWIGSSLSEGLKFLVRSGMRLGEVSESEFSDSLGRVSLAENKIERLPSCELRCSKASTLLLQGNLALEEIPESFFRSFRSLRVLNLGGTRIQSLPRSLLELGELRSLLLRNCFFLEKLPPLGELVKLRELDLCATHVRELPEELENLTGLRQLNLSRTHYLQSFRCGTLSKLTSLEALDMTLSSYHLGTKGNTETGQASFEELGGLGRLFSLSVRVKTIPCLSDDTPWIDRLGRFQFFIGKAANSLPGKHDKRRVTISGLDLSGEWLGWLLKNSSSLVLNNCRGINEMLEALSFYSAENYVDLSSVNSCSFMSLRSLTITSTSSKIEQGGCPALYDLVPNLEELRLRELGSLKSVSEFVGHLGLLFPKLRSIEITRCPNLENLLGYGNLILALPSLEVVDVSFCEKLVELFVCTSHKARRSGPVAPSLKVLELKSLPRLKKVCRDGESWPRLERVCVAKCNLLAELPISSLVREIRGESRWWSGLKWGDPNLGSALNSCFKPID